jgi:hypothetical protein
MTRCRSVVPFSITATGVSGLWPWGVRRADLPILCDTHVERERLARPKFGERRGPFAVRTAGREQHGLRNPAQRERDSRIRGTAFRSRHAGHHLETQPRLGQRLELLAAAAEDHRVPALQAANALARLHLLHEQPVELLLRDRRTKRSLAHGDQLRVAAREAQDLGAHEPVVEHHVGRGKQLPATQCDQIGAARSRADEIGLAAALAVVVLPAFDAALERALGVGLPPGKRVLGHFAAHDSLPKMPALVGIRDRSAHAFAPRARELGKRAEALRHDRLDEPLDPACEDGRETAAADRNRDRRPIDDRRHDERAQLRIVDHVAETLCGRCCRRDPSVQRAVVRRRDHEPIRLEHVAVEAPRVVGDPALGHEIGERTARELGSDYVDLGPRAEQQRRAPLGDGATADDEARPSSKVSEEG